MTDYKLTPVEPTAEMVSEGARYLQIMSLPEREAAAVFRAMLAAAPDVQANLAGHMGAFTQVLASLAAAISLLERGGKKAAASDHMFEQMLNDYRAALEAGRNALSQQAEPVRSPRTEDTATILATESQEPAPVQDEVQAVIRNLRCIAKTVLSSEARSSMRADLENAIRLLATYPTQAKPCEFHGDERAACEQYSGSTPCEPVPAQDERVRLLARCLEVAAGFDSRLCKDIEAAIVAEARPAQTEQQPVAWLPYLADGADGVTGHYAIARKNPAGYREVWNLRCHRWAAFSDDVLTKDEALAILEKLEMPTAPKIAAKMPCGTAVTNVYEAYEAGKRAAIT